MLLACGSAHINVYAKQDLQEMFVCSSQCHIPTAQRSLQHKTVRLWQGQRQRLVNGICREGAAPWRLWSRVSYLGILMRHWTCCAPQSGRVPQGEHLGLHWHHRLPIKLSSLPQARPCNKAAGPKNAFDLTRYKRSIAWPQMLIEKSHSCMRINLGMRSFQPRNLQLLF